MSRRLVRKLNPVVHVTIEHLQALDRVTRVICKSHFYRESRIVQSLSVSIVVRAVRGALYPGYLRNSTLKH